MILFSETKDVNNLQEFLSIEVEHISSWIENQKEIRRSSLLYMQKISDNILKAETSKVSSNIITILDNLKVVLDKSYSNIQSLKFLKESLLDLQNNINDENIFENKISDYNSNYLITFREISNDSIEIQKFKDELICLLDFNFLLESNTVINNYENIHVDTKSNSTLLANDNVLIISEKDNKIILPYTIYELKQILSENSKEYTSLEEIVSKRFELSLNKYKNSSLARFREIYNLVKYRENFSSLKALSLAFKFYTNHKLNPAIIIACKTLNELEFYLDCLEENNLDKFSLFKIVYKISPSI